jgi:hypothetical protein
MIGSDAVKEFGTSSTKGVKSEASRSENIGKMSRW